jgi:hypothetical protein
MDECIRANAERVKADPDSSAISFMVNAKAPIPESQMISNVKIAIGGGINEPRDALLTILYGLLTNPDQLEVVKAQAKWRAARRNPRLETHAEIPLPWNNKPHAAGRCRR